MRVGANPGRWVVLAADVALVTDQDGELEAVDLESGQTITLGELLRAYRHDPDDPIIGWVRITIEPLVMRL